MGSVRAEVSITDPAGCPIAEVSSDVDSRVHSVSKAVSSDGQSITEEFVVDGNPDVDSYDGDANLTDIFSSSTNTVYRFSREFGRDCPCELVERHDCPVVDVAASDDTLHLAFHAPDLDVLRAVIADLEAQYAPVQITRLLPSGDSESGTDLLVAYRNELTDRQEEVLRTAYELGYFEHPKGANAGEVAATLEISTSTFTEHLAAAQRKILAHILEGHAGTIPDGER